MQQPNPARVAFAPQPDRGVDVMVATPVASATRSGDVLTTIDGSLASLCVSDSALLPGPKPVDRALARV
jgi:hypothetical protein